MNDEIKDDQQNDADLNQKNFDESEEASNTSAEAMADKVKKERDEYLDGWQRARAELINYKKDEAKRFDEMMKFSNESLIREMIYVLDTFDLAIVALEKEGKMEKGIYMIKSQIEDILRNHGLTKVMISVGQPFDPAICEAVAEVESDKEPHTVVEIVDQGYALNGKLIRPARVKVAK